MATKLKNPTSATAMAIQAQRDGNVQNPVAPIGTTGNVFTSNAVRVGMNNAQPSLLQQTATAVGQAVQPIIATAQQAVSPIVNALTPDTPAPATPPSQTAIAKPTTAG